MIANRGRDTVPEIKLRRELHRRGLRYRVDMPVLPEIHRRADIVFTRVRLAVYVDGCFWHGCPVHATRARANREYWDLKIAQNRSRDLDTDQRLTVRGWTPLRVWEHQSIDESADLIEQTYTRLVARPDHRP